MAGPTARAGDGRDARAVPDFVRLVPHGLRHTVASLAIRRANANAVQKMLGHASAATTLDAYTDLFDDDLDAVGNALSAVGAPELVGKMWARSTSELTPVKSIETKN